jgi:pyruvate/2-oxoglutarate/acetoin dehydrogenase E1 component
MTTVLESLNSALGKAMADDERVLLLGEDILDPYGGAFRVTRGLSDAYPGRVLSTPVSEAGIVGLASGMALRGLRPVVEIMFGDFVTLIADQVINHAAKFPWMYSGGKAPSERVRLPLVIRTPMGGRRGYGPTHSQTLEKLFLGVPGLRLLAPCTLGDPGKLLFEGILENEGPLLFIENKLLYLLPVLDAAALSEFEVQEWTSGASAPPGSQAATHEMSAAYAPTYLLKLREAPPPVLTLAAYGYMAELARQALRQLAYEQEVFAELVVPTQLAPFRSEAILASVSQTGRLLTIEEGTYSLGWGAEIVARTAETLGSRLRASQRLAARDLPIPASRSLEDEVLPSLQDIVSTARKIVQ